MGKNDMNHMQHLDNVALSDVAMLQSKEATYQGSWKRAGGRSAWFMARRNMDRLLTMMADPVPPSSFNLQNVDDTIDAIFHENKLPGTPEATAGILRHLRQAFIAGDVFAKIAEHPKGEDGTVLACIRDLRRYFTLVEAEMIAEGVVVPEEAVGTVYQRPETDLYQMLADEFGITREVAKERVYQALFKAETSETPVQPLDIQVRGNGGRFQEADVKFPARELSPEFDKVLCDGLVYQKGHKPRPPTNAEVELLKAKVPAFPEMRPDTPSCGDGLFDTHQQRRAERAADDGAQHSSLVPWWIGTGYHDTLAKRVGLDLMDAFYSRRTPDIWCLEPVVLSGNIPRELQTAYDFTKVDNVSRFVLKRNEVPAELDDQFPRLQVEMNVFEWETSEEAFRFMYSPVGEKMILRQDYMNWARSN